MKGFTMWPPMVILSVTSLVSLSLIAMAADDVIGVVCCVFLAVSHTFYAVRYNNGLRKGKRMKK